MDKRVWGNNFCPHDKRNPIAHRRRRLVQKGGGFLPFLLTSVLEQLANFL